MRARWFLTLAAGLWLAAGARDAFDDWVDATVLPPLVQPVSVEVKDRDGALLRAYTVADGRWRLKADLDSVDPRYIAMLLNYEDRRFYDHATRWMVNEVALHKLRQDGSRDLARLAKHAVNAQRGRLGMRLAQNEREIPAAPPAGRGWDSEQRANEGW